MKKQVTFFIVFILFLTSNIYAQTQNNIWSLPPNYYDFSTQSLQALPTPGLVMPTGPSGVPNYSGEPSEFMHNAMQDANGDLLFFIIDGVIYDKEGYGINEITINHGDTYKGYSDILIVPVPNECQKFYIIISRETSITHTPGAVGYSILDLSVESLFTQRKGILIDPQTGGESFFSLNNVFPLSNIPNFNASGESQNKVAMAVTKLRTDNTRLLYISGVSRIFRFKITSSNIEYDNLNELLIGSVDKNARTEMEIIETSIGYRLAYSYEKSDGAGTAVYVAELNTSGDFMNSNTLELLQGSNTPPHDIKGIEFSPNGDFIYLIHDTTANLPSPLKIYDVSSQSFVTITNSALLNQINDFKYSQIELGADNKLYLANDTHLATIDNSNNPSSLIWNNSAVPISYNLSRLGLGNLAGIGSLVYPLPDQIDGMDYSESYFVNTVCCIENAPFDIDEYRTNGTQTWYPWSNPWTTTGVVTVRDKLVISAGSNVTINFMNFEFAPDAQLIVEDGAQLRIDNTRLTVNTDCTSDAMWRGVEVWGNGSFQPATSGKFIADNSSIENAIEGVVNYRHDVSDGAVTENVLVSGYTGGIIQLIDTQMLNNKFDVNMNPYQASVSNTLINDRSFFKNCNFITDDLLKDTSQLPLFTHVKLNGVDGIRFLGCTFKNNAPAGTYGYSGRGMGIFAQETKFSVDASCDAFVVYPDPCPNPNASTFTNLTFGISAVSNNGLKTARIENNEFQNVFRGVRLISLDAASVSDNIFDIGANAGNSVSYGLALIQCDGYKVENNDFHTSFDGYLGCGVINSGEGANEIYRNTFTSLKVGSQTSQVNGDEESTFLQKGLEFRCNTYTDIIDYDILVSSGRVRSDQGNCIPSNVMSPANNQFSYTAQYGDYWLNNPPSVSITSTYHYSQDGTMYNLMPRVSNINGINTSEQVCVDLPSFNIDQSCPLREKKTVAVLKNEKERLQVRISRLKEQNEESESEELQPVISFLEANLKRVDNEIIRQLLFNVDSNERFNGIIDFLQKDEERNTILENQLLIKALIANEDFVEARQKLKELKFDFIDTDFYASMFHQINTQQINKQKYHVKGNLVKVIPKTISSIKIEKVIPQSILKSENRESISEISDINIYPNPADDVFQLEHNLIQDNGDVTLAIFNMIGNKLIVEKINNARTTVNISSLKTGMYFYTIIQNNKLVKTDKLIIK